MGCGASDMRPSVSLEQQQRSALLHNAQAVESQLNGAVTTGGLVVGVFGLRGCGKSSLLHSIRAHLSSPPVASPCVPLPPPTTQLELFTGRVGDAHVWCVDTPGLPCASGTRELVMTALLPRLQRLIWVVDSDDQWSMEGSAMEMMQLWREVQRYDQQQQQQLPRAGAMSSDKPNGSAADHPGASASSPPPASPPASPDAPSLHIVCTKQHVLGAATTKEVAAHMGLSKYLSPVQLSLCLHAWSCEWEPARKEAAIGALLGATQPAPVTGTGGVWAAQRPSLTLPSPLSFQSTLQTTASLMSPSHVHLYA